MWNFFLVLLSSARESCKEGGPHVQEQERKWAEHVKPLLLGCLPQRWEVCSLCVCSDNLLLPCPLKCLLAADTGLMWRPCFQGRCASLIWCSFLACVCPCVCVSGRDTRLRLHSVPSSAVPVCFLLLKLCDAAKLFCAVPSGLLNSALWEGTNSKRALRSSGK